MRYGVPVVVGIVVLWYSARARRRRHKREGEALYRKLLGTAQDGGLCKMDDAVVGRKGALLGLLDMKRHMYAEVRLYRSGYASPYWWEKMWAPHIVLDQLQHIEHNDAVKKAFGETLYKLHARHAPGPHYYVAIVSTLPKNQGQGHYSELMRELLMTLNCAAHLDGLPCYLECTR